MLSRKSFKRAERFLFESARPLEKHLYLHLFVGLPVDQVVVELARYANPVGGYGHGIEPDLRYEGASALGTSVALQWMRLCKLDAEHEVVQHALGSMLDTLEPAAGVSGGEGWRIIPDLARTNDVEQAPWWSRPPSNADSRATFNPSAELLGYMIQWGLAEKVNGVATFLLDFLKTQVDPLESHDLLCLMRLAQTPNLPEELKAAVIQRLQRDAPLVAATDPSQWGGYVLMPLWLAPTPGHHAAGALGEDLLNANLDFEITRQHENGQWDPSWDWGPQRRAGWELAKPDWQGVLTLQTLLTLRAYDRIETAA